MNPFLVTNAEQLSDEALAVTRCFGLERLTQPDSRLEMPSRTQSGEASEEPSLVFPVRHDHRERHMRRHGSGPHEETRAKTISRLWLHALVVGVEDDKDRIRFVSQCSLDIVLDATVSCSVVGGL